MFRVYGVQSLGFSSLSCIGNDSDLHSVLTKPV